MIWRWLALDLSFWQSTVHQGCMQSCIILWEMYMTYGLQPPQA